MPKQTVYLKDIEEHILVKCSRTVGEDWDISYYNFIGESIHIAVIGYDENLIELLNGNKYKDMQITKKEFKSYF